MHIGKLNLVCGARYTSVVRVFAHGATSNKTYTKPKPMHQIVGELKLDQDDHLGSRRRLVSKLIASNVYGKCTRLYKYNTAGEIKS